MEWQKKMIRIQGNTVGRPKLSAGTDRARQLWGRGVETAIALAMISCVLLLSPLTAAAAGDSEPIRVAVFDFELIDTSLQGEVKGPNEAEADRLAIVTEQLRQYFEAAPGFSLADVEEMRGAAAGRKLHTCNGCIPKLAAQVGADLAVTGTVQKVSNLILNINIQLHDVATGDVIQAASADIRGNTDETWRRGMKWLVENRVEKFVENSAIAR